MRARRLQREALRREEANAEQFFAILNRPDGVLVIAKDIKERFDSPLASVKNFALYNILVMFKDKMHVTPYLPPGAMYAMIFDTDVLFDPQDQITYRPVIEIEPFRFNIDYSRRYHFLSLPIL